MRTILGFSSFVFAFFMVSCATSTTVQQQTSTTVQQQTTRFRLDDPTKVMANSFYLLHEQILMTDINEEEGGVQTLGGKEAYDQLLKQLEDLNSDALAVEYLRSLDGVRSSLITLDFVKFMSQRDPTNSQKLNGLEAVILLPDGNKMALPLAKGLLVHSIIMRASAEALAKRQPPRSVVGTYEASVTGECPFQPGVIQLTQRDFVVEGTRDQRLLLMGALGQTRAMFLAVEQRYGKLSFNNQELKMSIAVPDQPPELYGMELGRPNLTLSGMMRTQCTITLAEQP
jgi:hypothetical protein